MVRRACSPLTKKLNREGLAQSSAAGERTRSKIPVDFHPVVEDADDIDPVGDLPEKDDMGGDGIFPVAGADIVARTAERGFFGDGFDRS